MPRRGWPRALAPGGSVHHQLHDAQRSPPGLCHQLKLQNWDQRISLASQVVAHIFPTYTSSYLAGLVHVLWRSSHARTASPRLSHCRGRPRIPCGCPKLSLPLFTRFTLSCLQDFAGFMHLNHFEKWYLPWL